MGRGANPIVGIDLGTTNSLVAVLRDGQPEVLMSRDGRHLVPSVALLEGGEWLVGDRAKARKVRDPRHTVFSVKRLLGHSLADLGHTPSHLPYELVETSSGVGIRMGDKLFSPIEISAVILRELRLAAEAALDEPVKRAVITVPAYFNDSQRQATRAAGRLAGWDVLRILNEPTAAALAYGLDQKKQGLIAVYDLGGGTFDVSILRLKDGIFEVLATNGHTELGGDDLDRLIADRWARELGIDWTLGDPSLVEVKAQLIERSEEAKIALSTQDLAETTIFWQGQARPVRISRATFEADARNLLSQTRGPCEQALRDAGLRKEDLSNVILVGGPTRLQVVVDMVRDIFGREADASMHPDEVVACGAAIQADILAGNNRDLLLLDVVPLSLGMETYGGLTSVFIPRNTRIPTVARESFTTFIENQTGVDIHVIQGERDRVADNRSLARFKLTGIAPQPAGIPRIEVTFLVDADGILQVSAQDLKTGVAQSIEVRPSYGLTDAEVEGMLQASMTHAEEDIAFRRLVDARNEADPVLRAAERNLPRAKELLPSTDADKIELRVEGLRRAMQGGDPGAIREASQDLDRSTVRLAELLIKEAIDRCQK